MNNFIFEVKSKVVVSGDGAGEFYKLSAINAKDAALLPQEISISLDGDWKIGALIKLSFTEFKQKNFNFLHHFDRPNQGDLYSGPYHYFSFENIKKISWDEYIVNNVRSEFHTDGVTIIGGGIYFTNNKPRLKSLMSRSKHFVAWGIGLDPRSDVSDFLRLCSLVGTRERKSAFIDNKKVFYVPCVSCMNPVFDRREDINQGVNDVVLHLNGGFNEKELMSQFPNAPVTTTVSNFEEIIKNIGSAKCVVTNSYHGAYWGALLGKKVVCLKTKVPKWDGLHKDIVFSDVEDLDKGIDGAKNIPVDYLYECREINETFYKKVMELDSDI